MQFFFAHAGEAHADTASTLSHMLLGKWYFALPLYIAFLILLIFTVYRATRKSLPITYLVLLIVLFAAGIGTYTSSPAISILSISVGFGMALLQVLLGLGSKYVRFNDEQQD